MRRIGPVDFKQQRNIRDAQLSCSKGTNNLQTHRISQGFQVSRNVASHSKHVVGLNALYCDAHVQFLSNAIDLAVWKNLGSRAGGEVIGDY